MSIWFGQTKVVSTFVLAKKEYQLGTFDVFEFDNPHYGQEKKTWLILLGSAKEVAWKPQRSISDAV